MLTLPLLVAPASGLGSAAVALPTTTFASALPLAALALAVPSLALVATLIASAVAWTWAQSHGSRRWLGGPLRIPSALLTCWVEAVPCGSILASVGAVAGPAPPAPDTARPALSAWRLRAVAALPASGCAL